MDEKEIELKAQFASIYGRLRAIKVALTEDQLKIYSGHLQDEKRKFLEKYPDISEELREKINLLFI